MSHAELFSEALPLTISLCQCNASDLALLGAGVSAVFMAAIALAPRTAAAVGQGQPSHCIAAIAAAAVTAWTNAVIGMISMISRIGMIGTTSAGPVPGSRSH